MKPHIRKSTIGNYYVCMIGPYKGFADTAKAAYCAAIYWATYTKCI